jgi:hypothetical protein
MLADLPPASRILYKFDFQGMYHCVTQVVYMHYPSYERRRQVDLARIRASDVPPVHTLAVLQQIYPEAHLAYEDEALLKQGWSWVLLAGGTLYLVHCPSEPRVSARDRTMRVFTCPCVWTLFALTQEGEGKGLE